MRRIIMNALICSFAIIIAFTTIGLINYANKQDNAYSESVSAEIFELKNSMSNLYIDKETYEKELAEIEDKIDYWIFEQEMVKNEQTGHQSELKNIEAMINDLQDQINATIDNQFLLLQKAEYEADKVEIEAQISACETRLAEISTEIATLKGKVSTIESQLSSINREIQFLDTQIDDLYAKVNALNKNICTTYLRENASSFPLKTYVALNMQIGKCVGNKLSLEENGGIKIGAGVSTVLVSYYVQYNALLNSAGLRYVSCFRNETMMIQALNNHVDSNQLSVISGTPCLLSVQQGDVLTLRFYTHNDGDSVIGFSSQFRTYMTVEVVE